MKNKKDAGKNAGARGSRRKAGSSEAQKLSDIRKNRRISRNFPQPDANGILVCPVGGVNRIGMNMTLYGHAGRWVMVDAGSAFAKDVDGVGGIMPDPKDLAAILPALDALIVTHAHEDHIGAIHHLWPTIKCPIHATPFAAHLLRLRFEEKGTLAEVDIRTFAPGDDFTAGPFRIETIRVTHSTPECVAVALSAAPGTILHTGDWKLDPEPLVGPVTDEAKLKAIGDRGVLAMLSDSTNAERDAGITSEADVARNFETLFRKRRGAVAIACFATNVARLAAIGRAAAATGRKVGLVGRSLERSEAAARECGLIGDDLPFLMKPSHLRGLEPHETVIVCTGTQGEERAALSKLARREARMLPEIGAGDVVVHSARPIPGNEAAIEAVMSLFRDRHVEVLMGAFEGKALHVTGHAGRGELVSMYGLARPRHAVPVHGEPSHMKAHAELALGCGASSATLTSEGDVLRIREGGVELVAQVRIGRLATLEGEGSRLVPWDEKAKKQIVRKRTEKRRRRRGKGRGEKKAAIAEMAAAVS